MIKKFTSIQGMAVFKDFKWDQEVLDPNGAILEFKDINILYGRNYSGKTTLSRAMRAMEIGELSKRYEFPQIQVLLQDGTIVTQLNLAEHNKEIRVFNEDFIRENLKFITNPDDSVEPFAILGEDNNKIEQEITALESELGSDEPGKETGLNIQLLEVRGNFKTVRDAHKQAKEALEKKLSDKAIDRQIGIKYKFDRFGDQNYNATKLNADIKKVLESNYTYLDEDQIKKYEQLITEKILPNLRSFNPPVLELNDLTNAAESHLAQKISSSDKIEELVRDAILNKWVHDGKALHEHKLDNCAFCGNLISEARWEKLDKHFDAESESLKKKIELLIEKIDTHSSKVATALIVDKSLFYSKFHDRLDSLEKTHKAVLQEYQNILTDLRVQLRARYEDIFTAKVFEYFKYDSSKLKGVWDSYTIIQKESEEYRLQLGKEQIEARNELRLHEVFTFVVTIKYEDAVLDIQAKAKSLEEVEKLGKAKLAEINEKRSLIESKKRELNDEEKGAKKVNEFLNDFFGHKYLSLESQATQIDGESVNRVRFEVIRDGKKAYHLSEGECSLLAFCYFMAKLDDTYTKNTKPIIWIDDPISSLDSNHVFFIYSLINAEIVSGGKFEQVFISTHNLDFLKYLKRLTGWFDNGNGKLKEYNKCYFLISRKDTISTISGMPKYLKDYVTEFNYLFHQIFKCSQIQSIDDSNYTTFYNFGNNARKFLEIYLYYKFPDQGSNSTTLKLFFGEDIPTILTDRLNNEYSHLSGSFERGATPVEAPEMKATAQKIIDRLKQDKHQYDSLLKSIGEAAEPVI